ncbi:hypothetical protein [Sinosporangium siamense]|uniref:hypothetical protein n=1 Tax=Sinosporangium siamense TaxID=1367973 RepID=UPI0019516E9D|nr:hypothetical protein [Sinosporangium siamense]
MIEAIFPSIALFGPPVFVISMAILTAKVVSLAGSGATRASRLWRMLCLFFACIAGLTYSIGVWTGGFFSLRPTYEQCGLGATDESLRLDYGPLPLTNTCKWLDGRHIELVPAFVNPVFFAAIAVATACGITAAILRRADS